MALNIEPERKLNCHVTHMSGLRVTGLGFRVEGEGLGV